MKKGEFRGGIRLQIPDQSSYYKEGEQAAVHTFTKAKLRHKLSSLSPHGVVKADQSDLIRTKLEVLTASSPEERKIKRKLLSPPIEKLKSHKSELKVIQNSSVRDISHIKDALSCKSHEQGVKFFELPLDIEVVKKNLIHAENIEDLFKKAPVSLKLLSPELNGYLDKSETLDIDRFLIQSPSGRQESENLTKWIEKMKETCQNDQDQIENLNAVYVMAAKEVVRQVSVHCFQRGEVLQDILKFFIGNLHWAKENIKNVEKNTKKLKKVVFEDFKKRESVLTDKIKNLEHEIKLLNEKIEKKTKKISDMNEKILQDNEIIQDLKLRFDSESENCLKSLKMVHKSSKSPKLPKFLNTFSKNMLKVVSVSQSDQEIQTIPLPEFPSTRSFSHQTEKNLEITKNGFGVEVLSSSYQYRDKDLPLLEVPKDPPEVFIIPFNRGRKSSNSSAQAYRQRTKKSVMSPINELVRRLKEKEKHIKMLQSLLENQESLFENSSFKKKSLPKITFNPAEDLPSFDLVSFQTGFKSGFDNGYSLGFKDVQNESGNSSASEQLEKSEELFSKSEDDSFEQDLDIERQSIRASTLQKEEKNSDTSANDSFLESFQEESEKKPRKPRKSILKMNFLLNPEFTGAVPRPSAIPLTQIVQFNLTMRVYKDSKHQLPVKILDRIMDRKIRWFKKRAYFGRKMINKMTFSFYLSYFAKSDQHEPFIFFVYEELSKGSGLKSVGDKKFVHFMSSLIVLHPSKRPSIFLKFLGAGPIINSKNFFIFSLRFYLECLHFMTFSKIGICTIDETLDKIMLPLSRAIECIKEKLEKFDKSSIGKTISFIESQAEPDPKRINKTGVVECELLLEVLINVFEEFQVKVMNGVEMIVGALKYEEDKSFLLKSESLLILRTFSPDICDQFDSEFTTEEILIEDFCRFAIEKAVLTENDIKTCVPFPPMSSSELFPIIKSSIDENLENLKRLKTSEKLLKFWNYKTLKQKVKIIENSLHRREVYECLLASEIYKKEITRIKSL